MKNIRTLDTCVFCKHCVVGTDYDSPNRYFCNAKGKYKPDTYDCPLPDAPDSEWDAFEARQKKLRELRNKLQVCEMNVCDLFERLSPVNPQEPK